DRRLVVVGDLLGDERLGAAAQEQLPLAGDPQVADPLRMTARRDKVALAVDDQEIDRGGAPLAALAAPDGQDSRAQDADAEAGQPGDELVEDVSGEPARLLVPVRCLCGHGGLLGFLLSPLTLGQFESTALPKEQLTPRQDSASRAVLTKKIYVLAMAARQAGRPGGRSAADDGRGRRDLDTDAEAEPIRVAGRAVWSAPPLRSSGRRCRRRPRR